MPSANPGVQPRAVEGDNRTRQTVMVLALIALVVAVDQAVKWWAWRHVPWTRINSGGDILVGHTIGALYSGRVTGALLDLLDFGVLSIAVSVLARCRVPATVGVSGALMTGGWSSNLLDRLGTHYWTAPDSVRGAIDFIHIGEYYYNLADFFIIGCTPLFLLAAGYETVRAARRLAAAGNLRPLARGRLWSWVRIPALAGAGLTLVVALGAANYGGVDAAPPRPPAHTTTRPHVQLVRQVLVAPVNPPANRDAYPGMRRRLPPDALSPGLAALGDPVYFRKSLGILSFAAKSRLKGAGR